MSDDVKEEALKQAQEAYIIFHKFLKYFGYTMLFLIFLLYLNDFFNDPTASRPLPEDIADQYDPKGLNHRTGTCVNRTTTTALELPSSMCS